MRLWREQAQMMMAPVTGPTLGIGWSLGAGFFGEMGQFIMIFG